MYEILILVIVAFLWGRVLSSKHAPFVYSKIDKLHTLEVVSYHIPFWSSSRRASRPTSNSVVTNWFSFHEGNFLLLMKFLGVHMKSIGFVDFCHVYTILYEVHDKVSKFAKRFVKQSYAIVLLTLWLWKFGRILVRTRNLWFPIAPSSLSINPFSISSLISES